MAATPFTFRSTNNFSILKVSYNTRRLTFNVAYNCTKPRKDCPMAVFTLNVRETSPQGEVTYIPWLITSPSPQAKFELPLAPYLFSSEVCVQPVCYPSEAADTGKKTAQCVLRVHYTTRSGIPDFPFVCVGEPQDIAELVGFGPKMTAICLYKRALDFLGRTSNTMNLARILYRNKTKEYFGDIFLNHGGIMRPYLKDITGDPDCPISNRLKGLFFSTSVTGFLLPSPFGPHRFVVPLIALLGNMGSWQFYFADFYCFDKEKNSHHVNLVVCEKDTEAYKMCEECLLALPPGNPFLEVAADHSTYAVTSRITVEVIYTKEIDIVRMCRDMGAIMQTVPSYGTSDPRGIPKNPKCTRCNRVSLEQWQTIPSSN